MGGDAYLTVVGKIIKPHGLGGELKVFSYIKKPEYFKNWKTVFVQRGEEEGQWLHIDGVRFQHKWVLLKFADINERNSAELFRDSLLYIDSEAVEKVAEDSFSTLLINDFIVETVTGKKIGVIEDILLHSAQNILVVKKGNKELLIPFVKEFVKQIDMENRKVIISPIEGLLDNAN
jgi:16S rRNA processing protein RimM